jgi:uncharacterized alkaline shock family protein YloU
MTLQADRTVTPPLADQPVPPRPREPTDPVVDGRGSLVIGDAVVRRVAEYAADLTPGTARTTRRVAGVGVGERGASARITAQEGQVDIRLDLALHYPANIRDAVRAVREHVTAEINRVTGYRVRSMDVTVSALVPESSSHSRVE